MPHMIRNDIQARIDTETRDEKHVNGCFPERPENVETQEGPSILNSFARRVCERKGVNES